jgi:hypothetical protein
MKKLYIKLAPCILLLAFLTRPAVNTYSQLFNVGDKMINAGIGIGRTYGIGTFYKTTLPPIFISGDYGFKDDIGPGVLGLGGYLGFSSYKYDVSGIWGSWGWKYTSIIVGGRGTYHMEFIDDLDTYGGLLLGFNIISSKYFGDETWATTSASSSGIAYSFFVGGRYFFTDNLGVIAELGYGIAWLSLGITLKLE